MDKAIYEKGKILPKLSWIFVSLKFHATRTYFTHLVFGVSLCPASTTPHYWYLPVLLEVPLTPLMLMHRLLVQPLRVFHAPDLPFHDWLSHGRGKRKYIRIFQ